MPTASAHTEGNTAVRASVSASRSCAVEDPKLVEHWTRRTSPDRYRPTARRPHAKLANGKAEVNLTCYAGHEPDKPTRIANFKHFAATWNGPFDGRQRLHREGGSLIGRESC